MSGGFCLRDLRFLAIARAEFRLERDCGIFLEESLNKGGGEVVSNWRDREVLVRWSDSERVG